MGETIKEEDQAVIILNGLPDQFKEMRTVIMYSRDTLTLEDVMSTLRFLLKSNVKRSVRIWKTIKLNVEVMWKERNAIIHGIDRSHVEQFIVNLNRQISVHRLVALGAIEEVLIWTPPPKSWMCCNCDVSMGREGSVVATVFRDEHGSILITKAKNCDVFDPKIAEAHAVCMAAELTMEKKMEKVMFQSDNLRVVTSFLIESESEADFNLVNLCRRYLRVCSTLKEWRIVHVSRKGNFMAHNLASWENANGAVGIIQHSTLDMNVLNDYVEWQKNAG
ncbi:hypothetical protein G4B88_025236 [Cannabis sativa]|uniref:RNase H type-1 domain-containing protein n=1 Tax=Cannabis sativa TaxID=3483 RepID=A0A7J6HR34_CANSA|nr:hypothetical protein G4B88_025236 [Cannabis sativa]